MVCGGYVRPIDRLMADVPWIGWLAYLTPALYTFEIIMATEFHGVEFACATDSIIPQGLGYGDPAFQGCTYRGVAPGLVLNGDAYIAHEFSFSFGSIGADFGILFLFLFGLLGLNMILSENIDWSARVRGGSEYAHSTQSPGKVGKHDEETLDSNSAFPTITVDPDPNATVDLASEVSAFTWKNICYSTEHKRDRKQLLYGISGFCTSGSLTALVGPSGAGKTTCKFITYP
jgi:ABC-type multidrug transport system fused ATPase/permease subunit